MSQEIKTTRQWNLVSYTNHTKNVMEKLFPDPFLKNPNWGHLWIDNLKFIYFVLIVCRVEVCRKWLKLSCETLAFTSYKAFLKNKKRSGASLPASFLHDFWRKIFLQNILPDRISMSDCLYFLRNWAICVLSLFVNRVVTS